MYRSGFRTFARIAAVVTGDAESGRDAVQEAFVTAVRKRRSFRGDGPLEAWVWRIVLNTARSQVRARKDDALPALHTNGTPSDPREAELRAAFALLPERQRLAVFLRYYADLDYESIAQALDVKRGTVAATLHAAHAALRQRLEEVTT